MVELYNKHSLKIFRKLGRVDILDLIRVGSVHLHHYCDIFSLIKNCQYSPIFRNQFNIFLYYTNLKRIVETENNFCNPSFFEIVEYEYFFRIPLVLN